MDRAKTLLEQIQLMQSGGALDRSFLIEELSAMSRSEKRAVFSYVRQIILHVIKLRCTKSQAILERDGPGWRGELNNFRAELEGLLEESPSLRRWLDEALEEGLKKAKKELESEGYLDSDCVRNTTLKDVTPASVVNGS